MLTAVTLVGGGVGDGGARAGAGSEVSSAQELSLPYWGQNSISGCWGRSPEGQTQASSVLRTTPLASGWGPWSKGALHRCSAHVSYIGLSCLQCAAHVHTSNCFPCSYLDKALSDGKVHLSLSNAVKGIFFPFPISSTECWNLSSGNLNIYKVSLTCGCLLKSALSRFTLSAAKKDWGQFIDSCWFNSPYTKNYLPITWYTQVGETPLKSTGL